MATGFLIVGVLAGLLIPGPSPAPRPAAAPAPPLTAHAETVTLDGPLSTASEPG
jgi:hypothetical protein